MRQSSVLVQQRHRVHTVFPDESEMIEEFELATDALVARRMRRPTTLGGQASWVWEVGDNLPDGPAGPSSQDAPLLAESGAPVVSRRDTPDDAVLRIRNLFHPVSEVVVDTEKDDIVVRTANKKYFKRLVLPDLRRISATLEPACLRWAQADGTLLIEYKKPEALLQAEHVAKEARAKLLKTAKA